MTNSVFIGRLHAEIHGWVPQIKIELKQHYQVEGLTDVRVIRDRQTSKLITLSPNIANKDPGQSRQFGFLRFPSLPQAQVFMERNTPLIYLYGNPDLKRDEPAKVRIVYSRERNDTSNDGGEGDWTCKVVRTELIMCRDRL